VEPGRGIKATERQTEFEGMVTNKDAIKPPPIDPNPISSNNARGFVKPPILKDSEKQFLKNLIADAICERLSQDVHLDDTNLISHLSVIFLL
jgi:hypothetical protein